MGLSRWLAYGGILIAATYEYQWITLAGAGAFRPIDFYSFYMGAALVRDGYGERLYDLALQAGYQAQLFGPSLPWNHLLPYVSPPHVALLMQPVTLLPVPAALALSLAFQLFLVVLLALVCLKADARFNADERLLLLASLVACPMLTVTVYKGQLSLVLLLCTLGWVWSLRRGWDASLATCLLVGTIKPQLILIPVLLTVLARRWKSLMLFAIGTAGLVSGSAVALGWRSVAEFPRAVWRMDSDLGAQIAYPTYMYNFKGFLSLLGCVHDPRALRLMVSAGLAFAVLTTVWLWRGRVDVNVPAFDLKIALSLLVGLFFCPHLYYYDSVMLMAVGYLVLRHCLDVGTASFRLVALALALILPPFFLESALVHLGDLTVRWPVVLMIAAMTGIALMLGRASLARSASRNSIQSRIRR